MKAAPAKSKAPRPQILGRAQLRAALKRVSGLTERNRRESRETLCRQYRIDVGDAERARMHEIAEVRRHVPGDLRDLQAELIRLTLIQDVRVQPRRKPKKHPMTTAKRRLRNKAKAQRRAYR
jgi:hypothetical protein